MLKKLLVLTALVTGLWATEARATTILLLDPPGGAITGAPATTVGWGFTLYNDVNYLVVSGSSFAPASPVGVYSDIISQPAAPFFVLGPSGPYATPLASYAWNPFAPTGMGSFAINPLATPGDSVSGAITLTYDLYSVSPFDPQFDPNIHTLQLGNEILANASVRVVPGQTPIPEPTSILLVGSALAGAWRARQRRRTQE